MAGEHPLNSAPQAKKNFEPRFLVFNGKPKGAHRIPFGNGRQRKRSLRAIVAGKHPQPGQTNHAKFRQIHPATFRGSVDYILTRGMDAWRNAASMCEYGNGNVELPQRATSDLPR